MYRWNMTLLVTAVVACWASASGFGQEQTKENTEPILEYARDASTIVIQVVTWSATSRGDPDDATPWMRIYGNGRVLVHRSTKPKGERSYETWLSNAEMGELLRFLYDHGAMEYEYGVVKKKVREVALQSRIALPDGNFKHTRGGISDGTHTIIEISLTSFRLADTAEPAQSDFTHRTGGYALAYMAKEYPEVEEARKLAAVERKFWELTRSRDLKPTTAPPAHEQP